MKPAIPERHGLRSASRISIIAPVKSKKANARKAMDTGVGRLDKCRESSALASLACLLRKDSNVVFR